MTFREIALDRDGIARAESDPDPNHFRDLPLVYMLDCRGCDATGRPRYYRQRESLMVYLRSSNSILAMLRAQRRGHRPTLDKLT